MKLETNEEVSRLSKLFVEKAKQNGLNVKEDEWKVVQPYKNGQVITISVSDDDNSEGRTMKVDVNDSTFVLNAIDEELDVFN